MEDMLMDDVEEMETDCELCMHCLEEDGYWYCQAREVEFDEYDNLIADCEFFVSAF